MRLDYYILIKIQKNLWNINIDIERRENGRRGERAVLFTCDSKAILFTN